MLRVLKLAAVLPILAVFALAVPVSAAVGQIEGGDIYWAKNITGGGSYVDPSSANAGDTLSFRVRIHNPGEACLTNVNVKAALPTGNNTVQRSTITVWADAATTNYISDTATVNLSSAQSLSFVAGSVQLLDNNGVVSNLPDTILTSGVNIGSVCVSTNNERFVQFKATVSTPTPQPQPQPKPQPKPVVKAETTALPNTGAGDVLGIFAGASAAGAAGHYVVARRNRR